jgi:hypothetical protein
MVYILSIEELSGECMDYLYTGGYFSEIYQEPYPHFSDGYDEIFICGMAVNFNDHEIYNKAATTFIIYLEEKQKDCDWLMINQDLVIELFNLLIKSFDSGNLLPAIKLLENDPEFFEMLTCNIRNLLMHQKIAA